MMHTGLPGGILDHRVPNSQGQGPPPPPPSGNQTFNSSSNVPLANGPGQYQQQGQAPFINPLGVGVFSQNSGGGGVGGGGSRNGSEFGGGLDRSPKRLKYGW
jgi:hypothetical protein